MTDLASAVERAASIEAGPDTPPQPDTHSEAPYWPVTRLVSWSLTLLLAVEILVPAAGARGHALDVLALLLPTAVATVSARGLFETLGVTLGHRGLPGRIAASIPAALVAIAVMIAAGAIVDGGWSLPATAISAALLIATLIAAGSARDLEIRLRRSMRRVFFAGSLDSRRDLERELARRMDARLVDAGVAGQYPTAASLVEAVLASRATVLVLDDQAIHVPQLVDAAAALNLSGIRVRDLVSYYESEFKKVPLGEISSIWFLFDIASIHRQRVYRALRRSVDVTVAAIVLLISLPGLIVTAMLIRLSSPGPALYRQRRVGKDGLEFTLLKLRTMREPEAIRPPAWAPAESHRITAVGAFLRRFRLDELPQMWNVIRGDLALIGPRPEQVAIAAELGQELAHYSSRHCVRPGITGWAQVNLGYAGSLEGSAAKLQRDLYYVKHSGLRLDALIVWLTLKAILLGPDAESLNGPRA